MADLDPRIALGAAILNGTIEGAHAILAIIHGDNSRDDEQLTAIRAQVKADLARRSADQ